MTLPVRHLPVLQNWDCQGCTNCCREYRVYLNDAERGRIAAQDWQNFPDLANVPSIVREGPAWAPRYRLNQRADGCCVFLSDQGRCRIHERFGSDAKPLACRLYPFVLVPAGDHWRVGLRFSCPAAANNQGRPLTEHLGELRQFAAELERQEGAAEKVLPPPALQGRQSVDWPDLLAFVTALLALLKDRHDRMERRWRKCLALASLCRQAKFDQVKGARLAEFLALVSGGLETEVAAVPESPPPPTWVGRVLFRQALAAHARKDVGPERGPATRSRLSLLRSAWRFARGRGAVPRLHGLLPETTFEHAEAPAGPLPEAAEQVLERYYLAKVGALQFCGSANFGMSFWQGLEALALTFPIILWLARAFGETPREEAVTRAIRIVDHPFGYSPLLGARRQRFSLGMLARRGELEKLVAWYSR
jgi:lysine-N-methylase